MIEGEKDSVQTWYKALQDSLPKDACTLGGFDAQLVEEQKKDALFAAAMKGKSGAIALADANQVFTYWSAAAERMFGFRADEILGRPVASVVQREYPGCEREKAFIRLAEEGCFEGVAVLRHKNGSPVYAHIFLAVLPGGGEKAGSFFILFQDILVCIKRENILQPDPERDDAVAMADLNQIVTSWNAAAEKLFGWRADEVVGRTAAGLLGPEYPGCGREQSFARLNETGCFRGEALLLRKNGSPVYVNIYSSVRRGKDEKIIGTFTVFREITGRRTIESTVSDRVKEYLDIIDSPTTGTFVHDIEKREAYYSSAWKKRLGAENLSPSELAGLPARVVHQDDYPRLMQSLEKAIAIRAARISMEIRVKTVDLGYRWILGDAKIQYDKTGKPLRYIGTNTDVTGQRTMTENLHFQADVLAGVHDGVVAIGQDDTICYWNNIAEKFSGIPAQDVLGKDTVHLISLSLVSNRDVLRIKQDLEAYGLFTGEVRVQGRDNKIIWGDANVKITCGKGGFNGIVATFRDITGRKEAEAQSERRNLVLKSINRVYQEYVACETLKALGEVCLQIAEEATGSGISFLGEKGEDGLLHEIAMSRASGEKFAFLNHERHGRPSGGFPIRGLFGEVFRTGETLLTNNPANYPQSRGIPEGHHGIACFLAVPFLQGGQVHSLLAVGNRPGGYGENEREILEALTPTIIGVLMRKRAEIALKESENLYRTLFENTNDAFMLLDPIFDPDDSDRVADIRFVQVSRNFVRQTGVTPEEIAGKTLLGLFPESEPYWLSEYGQAAHSRVPLHYQNYHAATRRWYDMFCFPYGKGFTGVLFRDITAKKQTETELLRVREELAQRAVDKYQSLFQSIDEGFCILQVEVRPDSPVDYYILEANAQYLRQAGIPTGSPVPQQSMRERREEISEEWYELLGQVAKTGNPERRTSAYSNLNNSWFDIYAFPAGEIGTGLVAVLLRDVTERKRSEDALRENERLYRTIFENSQDGFSLSEIVYDEKGRPVDNTVLKINKTYEKQANVHAADIVGKRGRKSRHLDQVWLNKQKECVKKGKTMHFEEYRGDTGRWFDVFMFPYGDNMFGELFQEITRRKQYEESLHQSELLYRKLFDNTEEGFMLCQPAYGKDGDCMDFHILSVNRGWELQTGLKAEEGVLEKTANQFFEKMEQNWFTKLGEVAKTGNSISFEEYNHHTGRWFDVRAFLYSEDVVGVMMRNITDRKQAEEALRQSQKKALRLVRELEEINRNKNEFLNMLSHELRNPLASISAGIQLLELTQNEEHTRRAKDVITRQMHQLCRLTDDLLDLTRISNNKIRLQREQVELNSLASVAAEDYLAMFDEKGVKLKICTADKPVLLEADPARLRQAIGNLLHNAMKFTDKGGEVFLQVSLESREAVVAVTDTGLGIEGDLLPRLFEPFRQADTALDQRNSGLGLGLSITRGIAQLHGGSVSAYSAGLRKGSSFCIRLPLRTLSPSVRETDVRFALPHKPLSILLIEDNADQAEILCLTLRELGHRAEYATNGEAGLLAALKIKPDLILCDIGLPSMNGYAVARAIRSEPDLSGTVLVALTGFASDKYKKRALEAGFDLHAGKPLDMDSLRNMLANIRGRDKNGPSGPGT